MTQPGDDDHQPAGQLIPFPVHRSSAGGRAGEVYETELADLADDLGAAGDRAGDAGGPGDSGSASAPPGTEIEPASPVLDAELVDDDQAPAGGLVARPVVVVRQLVQPVVLVARTVRQSERTVRTTKAVVRQLAYVLAGIVVLGRRLWEAKTNSRYERMMRAGESAGDWAMVGDWEQRGEQARERRHKRRIELLTIPFLLAKALLISAVALAIVLVMLGLALAVSRGDIGTTLDPLITVVQVIAWLVSAAVAVGSVLLVIGPFLLIGALWYLGRRAEIAPRWTRAEKAEPDQMDKLPDENTVLNALKNCSIPGLNRALKDGWRIKFLLPPVLDGKGWRTQLALPPACTVEDIVRKKTVLAHNLVRYPIEVWPTEPEPAVLDLWVAKRGALSGPVDPWPLLADLDNARTDYFTTVPVGVTIRGDVINGRLFEANYMMGGVMGSGKSTLAINLLLGGMLDPLVDVDVVVMAQNADYDPMQPRLRTLVTGAGEETVEACMNLLARLYDDLSVRGEALKDHDQRAVTRDIAELDDRLRPQIMVIDECQNLFIGKYGKDAIEMAGKVISTARKYALTSVFLTPEPSKDACPRKLLSVISNKACFAIGDHQGNDAVLGTGSFKSGISAVGLTPKTEEGLGDVGTCMARGFRARPGLMRCFYVSQSDAHRVTQRAVQLREGRTATAETRLLEQPRDLVADIAEVIGTEPVRAADVPALLARTWPRHRPYQRLTGKELVQLLADEGVKVPSTGNRWPVNPATVRAALARRAES